jgi:phospholipase C
MLVATAALLLGAAATVAGAPPKAAAATTPSASQPCGVQQPHPYKHVIWVWMENRPYNAIAGSPQAPYINSLANECGLATNYHNIDHPSLPNYIAATSGLGYSDLTPFLSDCNPTGACTTTAKSIFAQGETWKSYEESMPSNCYPRNSGLYAVRHNPPPYYTTLQGCSTNDVPYTQLATDLANNALPAFSFITPNVIDDMHDGTTAQGDNWLAANMPTILNSPEYQDGSTAVFLTWDEGEGGTSNQCATNTTDVGCHVFTSVISPSTPKGTKSSTLFNHYALLGTAEQLLHLPRLGLAASAPTMSGAFKL